MITYFNTRPPKTMLGEEAISVRIHDLGVAVRTAAMAKDDAPPEPRMVSISLVRYVKAIAPPASEGGPAVLGYHAIAASVTCVLDKEDMDRIVWDNTQSVIAVLQLIGMQSIDEETETATQADELTRMMYSIALHRILLEPELEYLSSLEETVPFALKQSANMAIIRE